MTTELKKITILLTCLLMMTAPVWAGTDYSAMTTGELNQIRGTMRNASQEERNAFRAEWQKRMQEMTREERRNFMGRPENGQQDGTGLKRGQNRNTGRGQSRDRCRGRGRRK